TVSTPVPVTITLSKVVSELSVSGVVTVRSVARAGETDSKLHDAMVSPGAKIRCTAARRICLNRKHPAKARQLAAIETSRLKCGLRVREGPKVGSLDLLSPFVDCQTRRTWSQFSLLLGLSKYSGSSRENGRALHQPDEVEPRP